jgi:dienelactone hydrolase
MMDATANTAGGSFAVSVVVGKAILNGDLVIPPRARGAVLFAHGSGSSRHSPRNRFVARELHAGGLATLLIDLLTPEEEAIDLRTRHLRFDIGLLGERLIGAVDWLTARPATRHLPIGLFGASTGAAAALVAAAARPEAVGAVVSRGGRPDLAGERVLRAVHAPTLLIVGGDDTDVIKLNRAAFDELGAAKELAIVPGASHLFEEPGTLEEVAKLARGWFRRHLDTTRDTGGENRSPEAERDPVEGRGSRRHVDRVGEPADVVGADLEGTRPPHGAGWLGPSGPDHDVVDETAG